MYLLPNRKRFQPNQRICTLSYPPTPPNLPASEGYVKRQFWGFSFLSVLKFVRFTQLFGTSLLIMALQCGMRIDVEMTVATVLKLVT